MCSKCQIMLSHKTRTQADLNHYANRLARRGVTKETIEPRGTRELEHLKSERDNARQMYEEFVCLDTED